MKNKNSVIVTGGLGFIGSNLIDLLLKKNFYVINLDKVSYSSNFYNIKDFKKNKNYKFIKCNILNKRKIDSSISLFAFRSIIGIYRFALSLKIDFNFIGTNSILSKIFYFLKLVI